MPPIFWIIGAILGVILVGPIAILIEKPIHWLMKIRGVNELTHKQKRGMAKRYRGYKLVKPLQKRKRKTTRGRS